MDRKCNTETQQFEHIHLQVEKLAVASVNEFRAVIGPGYFDDVNLGEKKIYINIKIIIRKIGFLFFPPQNVAIVIV